MCKRDGGAMETAREPCEFTAPAREAPLPPSRRTLSVRFVPSVRQSAPSTRNRMQNSKADLFCYPSELSRIFVMVDTGLEPDRAEP